MTVHVTDHALARARQRLGWPGSRQTLGALIAGSVAAKTGLQIAGVSPDYEWSIHMPRERMLAVLRGNVVVTVVKRGQR